MRSLKICIAAAEIVPFAKTGGLADVTGALGKYLKKEGHDARLFIPLYDILQVGAENFYPVEFVQNVPIHFEGFSIPFSLFTTHLPGSTAEVYLIHCPDLYYRGSVYTGSADEYLRFAFFNRAVLESCQRMGWAPDIIHCHDWHTALIPLYLQTEYQWDALFQRTKTMLTIHNIGYQGVFGSDVIGRIGLGRYTHRFYQEDLHQGIVNYLKTGLLYANVLTAVSDTYSREIQTAEYGAGLDYLLRMRSDRLVGIVNGVDYDEWNPATDRYLPYHYTPEDLSGKQKNKESLLQQLDLPYHPDVPVFGIVSRLTGQKGLELLMECLFELLAHQEVRFLVLGSGERKYEEFFASAQRYFRRKVCFYRGYSNELAHLIEAASDIFIMPSRYEPCGLNQVYSLKYGTVPIVRKTGGLADTVQLWNPETGQGTGFVFEHFSAHALRWALWFALETFHHKDTWNQLVRNGMNQNFSWDVQGRRYLDLYQWMAGYKKM